MTMIHYWNGHRNGYLDSTLLTARLHLGSNNPKCHQFKMGDVELDAIEQQKDLGVYICNDCKSSVQCTKSAQKANEQSGHQTNI